MGEAAPVPHRLTARVRVRERRQLSRQDTHPSLARRQPTQLPASPRRPRRQLRHGGRSGRRGRAGGLARSRMRVAAAALRAAGGGAQWVPRAGRQRRVRARVRAHASAPPFRWLPFLPGPLPFSFRTFRRRGGRERRRAGGGARGGGHGREPARERPVWNLSWGLGGGCAWRRRRRRRCNGHAHDVQKCRWLQFLGAARCVARGGGGGDGEVGGGGRSAVEQPHMPRRLAGGVIYTELVIYQSISYRIHVICIQSSDYTSPFQMSTGIYTPTTYMPLRMP